MKESTFQSGFQQALFLRGFYGGTFRSKAIVFPPQKIADPCAKRIRNILLDTLSPIKYVPDRAGSRLRLTARRIRSGKLPVDMAPLGGQKLRRGRIPARILLDDWRGISYIARRLKPARPRASIAVASCETGNCKTGKLVRASEKPGGLEASPHFSPGDSS